MIDASYSSTFEPPSSPPAVLKRARRKRTRHALNEYSNSSSSPPLFSSDAAEPSFDHYLSPRRKRQYRGTWWGPDTEAEPEAEAPSSTVEASRARNLGEKKRSAISRKFDSGVFMRSDDTEHSFSSDGPDLPFIDNELAWPSHTTLEAVTNPLVSSSSPAEHLARGIVERCLDRESEVVDLSDIDLRFIPDKVLLPLHSIIKLPRFLDGELSPCDHEYQSLQPSLQLFLSGNSLRVVNSKLFDLENITVLSLRNNALEILSPHVARLQNLVELNVAGNRLRYLPCELLSLVRNGKLKKLTVLPNPLFRPFSYESFMQDSIRVAGQFRKPLAMDGEIALQEKITSMKMKVEEMTAMKDRPDTSSEREEGIASAAETLEQMKWLLELYKRYHLTISSLVGLKDDRYFAKCDAVDYAMQEHPLFVASTPAVQFNVDGSLPQRQSPAPSQLGAAIATLRATVSGTKHAVKSRVPSLFEVALRTASRTSELPLLHTLMPYDTPPMILEGLSTALLARSEGGRECSVCGRKYIIPRTEWIEYWHLPPKPGQLSSKEEMFWPFLKRGCSPGCGPELRETANVSDWSGPEWC